MPWMVKPYSRRQLTREERIDKLQYPQRQEGGQKRFWNNIEPVQSTTGDHGAKSKGFQRHCFYMFGVAQHAEDTPVQGRQDTNLIQWPYKMNRQCMCLMRTYVGALAGQDRT